MAGKRELKWEASVEITIAEAPIAIGIPQLISCQIEWCAKNAVKLFSEIIRSEVPAALFCGV